MNAVITAGGIPEPKDPLYPYCQGGYKALLDIAGKPMIQWVLDALDQAKLVEKVVVVGLPEGETLACKKIAARISNQRSMLENLRSGIDKVADLDPDARQVLIVSSDIPAITGSMIDWLVKEVIETDKDIYYNVITRDVMEARFPASRRSYTRLKDLEVCGGDMNVVRASTVTKNDQLWERIIAARKNVFKQAALIGYDTLFLLLLRKITLNEAVGTVTKRLQITGQAIICPYAEIGMDIDKPHQLEIIRKDLAKLNSN